MKNFVLLAALLGSLAGVAARAQAPAGRPDTVVGQAHLTRLMSRSLCAQVTQESQKTDLSQLSPEASRELFTRLMFAAMSENASAFSQVMTKAGQGRAGELGRTIGQNAVRQLMQDCPVAAPLAVRMASSRPNAQLAEGERAVLQPIARAACQRLDTLAARQPFAQLAPARRAEVMQQVLQETVLKNLQPLMAHYGEATMSDRQQAEAVGEKLVLVMLEICPTYLMQMGRDALDQRTRPAGAPPAAKPGAAPARRTPARRPAPKG